MMKRVFKILGIYILILLILSGCWSRRELEKLNLVIGSGLDKGPDNNILFTVQIVKPGALKAPGGQGGGGDKPFWNITVPGLTAFDTFRNTTLESNQKVYYQHNRVLILGEEFARDGVRKHLDLFFRDHDIRWTIRVLVSKNKASEILAVETETTSLPGFFIDELVQAQGNRSQTPDVDLKQILLGLMSNGIHPVAPIIKIEGEGKEKKLIISKTAVFRDDKMVGELNEKESRGLLWIINQIKSGVINVRYPTWDGFTTLEILRASSQIIPVIREGEIQIDAKIKVESNIGSQMYSTDVTKEKTWETLNKLQIEHVTQEAESAIKKAKELKSDIFGFGSAIHREFPQQWKEMKKDWDELFPYLVVNVEVESELRESSLIIKPIRP